MKDGFLRRGSDVDHNNYDYSYEGREGGDKHVFMSLTNDRSTSKFTIPGTKDGSCKMFFPLSLVDKEGLERVNYGWLYGKETSDNTADGDSPRELRKMAGRLVTGKEGDLVGQNEVVLKGPIDLKTYLAGTKEYGKPIHPK